MPKILLIDDDAGVRRFCEQVLSEDGYYVVSVATARHALILVRDTAYDVIMLDLSLRDMDGLRLIQEIRDESPFSRILVMSGFMESFLHNIVLDTGAHAALAKPLSARRLRYSVYQLLDPSCSWVGMSS